MKENLHPALRGVTLKQLRAFAAVIRTGTVAGAADVLAVTSPAVSQQLRQLEEGLGVPLAERTAGGMRATAAGQEVLGALGRIEAALADCMGAIDALRGMQGGRVVVGAISTAKYFVPRALAAFMRSQPGVDIRLLVGNRSDIIGALRDLEIDIAVMGRTPEDFPVVRAVIGPHPHVLIAPPDHPLAGAGRISLSALAGETILLREAGSGTRELLRTLLAGAGLDPGMGMEMGSNETIKQAVMAGMGVALLSAHTVAAELADGRLVALDLPGLPVLRQWYVVRSREKRLLPPAQALWDHLAAHGAAFLPEVRLGPAGSLTPPDAAASREAPRLAPAARGVAMP
ncbi:HTH-type transcriptional regulator CbbR [Rhodovastum atsumiense]|uniref:HTH-type transcriptional regulator CbbR n=1 Tax=Rhodovastum atsumiense TaxID=504468 RepID=A0A5M6J2H5_9PROT|nr:LysR family transcriptional regulator [Rhodovastum atsumiense]KAA5613815.1 LysR family transcriptional regulator [Rhodovastum atsumiense]CAH2601915.1 HTH-type transcriptional regulator CbbR [Rhodovastum atsumiense]